MMCASFITLLLLEGGSLRVAGWFIGRLDFFCICLIQNYLSRF